jgi:hypothetical protein
MISVPPGALGEMNMLERDAASTVLTRLKNMLAFADIVAAGSWRSVMAK